MDDDLNTYLILCRGGVILFSCLNYITYISKPFKFKKPLPRIKEHVISNSKLKRFLLIYILISADFQYFSAKRLNKLFVRPDILADKGF